jgi:hypothetical protein
MTRQNIQIIQSIRSALGSPKNIRRFLFTVRAPSVVRINLTVLRILLEERKERGIYLSVEQPDKHVMLILERQNLAARAEVGILTENPKPPKRVIIATEMVNPVVLIDEIFHTLTDKVRGPTLDADMKGMSFIIVDNLATMAIYNTQNDINEFFKKSNQFLERYPGQRMFTVTARNGGDELHAEAKKFAQLEVDIPDEWLLE